VWRNGFPSDLVKTLLALVVEPGSRARFARLAKSANPRANECHRGDRQRDCRREFQESLGCGFTWHFLRPRKLLPPAGVRVQLERPPAFPLIATNIVSVIRSDMPVGKNVVSLPAVRRQP